MSNTSIRGTLQTMPPPDVLQWLLTGNKSGVLSVSSGGVLKRLYFNQGWIVGASSSDPDMAFGQFLLDLGKISEEQLVKLVVKQRETGVMLGRILTNEGILSEEEVLEVLSLKARETLFEFMAAKEGDFEFIEGERSDAEQVAFAVPIDRLIFEGIRRAEDRRRIREAFPSSALVPALLLDEARETMLRDEAAAPMVALIDHGSSLREIARELRLSFMDVCTVLYPYLSQGLLDVGFSSDPEIPSWFLEAGLQLQAQAMPVSDKPVVVPPVAPASDLPDPVRLREIAESFLEAGQFEEAMTTIERAAEMLPGSNLVKHVKGLIEEQYVRALCDFFKDGVRVPVLTVGLRELPNVYPLLTGEEAYVATRITSTTDVRSIVENAMLPELKSLRILRDFADSGLIVFRDEA